MFHLDFVLRFILKILTSVARTSGRINQEKQIDGHKPKSHNIPIRTGQIGWMVLIHTWPQSNCQRQMKCHSSGHKRIT